MTARVLIVEDHAILGSMLASYLEREGFEVESVSEMTDEAVSAAVEGFSPDAVVLDLELGTPRTGLAHIEAMRARGCEVVILTGIVDERRHAEALERGAAGIVIKASPVDELVDAVRTALDHRSVATDEERAALLGGLREARADERRRMRKFSGLTAREQDVLAALVEGKSAEVIAKERVVSLTTVRSHIRNILLKLDVHSQVAAVALARQADWRPD